jgi:hydrogenase 3 maturation protease
MDESWKLDLKARLVEPVVIVGIGNSMSGDDGAGPEVVRLLRGRTRATLFDCGGVPENFIGPIAAAKPACILLVDAAPVGAEPGHVGVFELAHIHGDTFHTHAASPSLFLDVLVERTHASCFMVGIQPKQVGIGTGMTPQVTAATRIVADFLAQCLPPS